MMAGLMIIFLWGSAFVLGGRIIIIYSANTAVPVKVSVRKCAKITPYLGTRDVQKIMKYM